MRVRFSTAAERDLEAIRAYTMQVAPQRVTTFMDALLDRCSTIADGPLRHPMVPWQADSGLRRRRYDPYLIFFEVGEDHIEILRILHERTDYIRKLGFDM